MTKLGITVPWLHGVQSCRLPVPAARVHTCLPITSSSTTIKIVSKIYWKGCWSYKMNVIRWWFTHRWYIQSEKYPWLKISFGKSREGLRDQILHNKRMWLLLLHRGLYNVYVSHGAGRTACRGTIRTHENHALEPIRFAILHNVVDSQN